SQPADSYLPVLRTFADNVLQHGRDVYGPKHTPLLIDGLNIDTREPATWVLPDDCAATWKMPKRSIMCNVASQQNLFRVLDGFSALTGHPRYRQAALEATRYALEHLQYRDGLLFWGGHVFVDLNSDQIVGESHKDWTTGTPRPAFWETGVLHELKFHYPHYELMWEANREATARFVRGFWAAHVQNWANLDMNRHGIYGQTVKPTWDEPYTGRPVPFSGQGLSFISTGTDLMLAAACLTEFTGDPRPLEWAHRLAERYEQIRHPETGLAAEVYNYYRNERLLAQFGPEFGQRLTETTIASIYGGRYGPGTICLLKLGEQLGDRGNAFRQLAIRDLLAFARHTYDAKDNSFRMLLIDGTPLSPADVKRPGPLHPDLLRPRHANFRHFWAYSLAATMTGDPLLWETARSMGRALRLGDIGSNPGTEPAVDMTTTAADPYLVFALLDLHRNTKQAAYLRLAGRIGDNLVAREFHKGFFVNSPEMRFAKFDSITPLALLHLENARRDTPVKLAPYYGGDSFFHCDYEGKGRTYDNIVIYSSK
ncbi:MAG TPA: hypothetical protein PLM77_18845, partial [Phycisphaerae bacterium]|nr:hypothetical protein [Phycisphaerae bacterium]